MPPNPHTLHTSIERVAELDAALHVALDSPDRKAVVVSRGRIGPDVLMTATEIRAEIAREEEIVAAERLR